MSAVTASPYPGLYAEALAARARHGGHVRQLQGRRSVTDGELVAHINGVLDRRPEARCTPERVVAVWLVRIVVAEDRWWRTWQQVVSARLMAVERAKLAAGQGAFESSSAVERGSGQTAVEEGSGDQGGGAPPLPEG